MKGSWKTNHGSGLPPPGVSIIIIIIIIIIKKCRSARPRESDVHPISPKTPAHNTNL